MSGGKQWLVIFGVLGGGAFVSGALGSLVPGVWSFVVALVLYSLMILAVIVLLAGSGEE